MIKSEAQKLKDNGIYIIPLLPNEKKNWDQDILTKKYSVNEVQPNGNLGVNLKQSDMYCIDPDTDWAIKFGEMWLQRNTRIGGRINNGKKELTKFFYKSDGSLKQNIKDRKDSSGETIAELFCDHNIVVYGSTPNKETQRPMKRYWESESQLAPFNESIRAIYDKICFASAIAPHLNQTNQGGLILDSCLWRYCKTWTDEDRLNFLTYFFNVVRPNSKHNTVSNWNRIIKSNNDNATHNAGYTFFADYIGVEREKVRTWFGWIGKTPGQTNSKKSFRNFLSTGIDMVKLRTEEIPPLRYAIRPILPEGLTLFCGRAKSMKSWKMLLICYAVRNGLKVMGHETIQGDCLYLGLEDSKRRLKDREKKLGLNKLTPPYVDVTAPYLDMGLEESLQNWIDSVPNPRLICIDTLARVKSRTGFNKAGTAYDHDNETLRNIQKLAIQNGVSIVLVSHLNKAPQDYAFDKITGSTGLQGICDAMWLIERGEHGAQSTFIGRGRDIMDFEYALNWNQETWRYDWVGNLQEVNLNDNRKEVIDAMRELEKTGLLEIRPRDVVKHCGYTPQSKDAHRISKTMLRMKNNFELTKGDKFGTYKLVEVNQPNY
jgi:hypothetical protein